jgi:long-chain fatty acid transport protein
MVSAVVPRTADAAGLFTADRGVRPLGRGGAFVAGADDLGAIWYNPAGLADAGTTLFIDLAWLNFSSEYTRKTQVIDAGRTVRTYNYPKVDGTTPFLPIPTLGGSLAFGSEKQFTVALGILAPYTAIASYPLTVGGQSSPSRYSLVSLDGSALVVSGAYFSYKPIEQIRIGGGLQALVGTFKSKVVFSASPNDRVISAPEDPAYDSLSQLNVGPIVSPSANFGLIAVPDKHVHLGASAQLPFWINAPAKIQVKLPNAAVFKDARQEGEDARVRFRLPPVLRFGAEYRTDLGEESTLRVELAYVREFWSVHDSIDLTPEGVAIEGIAGLPRRVPLPAIKFPRNFQDTNSLRLGGEYTFTLWGYPMDLRSGLSYETSAIPREYLSLLTIDMNKVTLALGGGLHIGDHWRLDMTFAHLFASSVNVSADTAKIPRVNPIAGNAPLEAVNGGSYAAAADLVGVGAQYTF